ncbi:amino acid ABC transporter permease [Anopheles sinensis]|uniref:Amino acid ABC transporter permease n=1 Tax=Anopheles sinensis TaxID=74873 RepID=A0A084VYB0_ANOSI|nr:amino acid ABC transporter permease [Anopheles sinensis]
MANCDSRWLISRSISSFVGPLRTLVVVAFYRDSPNKPPRRMRFAHRLSPILAELHKMLFLLPGGEANVVRTKARASICTAIPTHSDGPNLHESVHT